MPSSPTLQAIADAAGVAKSTVSYALRNSSLLPPETRERIQEIALRMGYKPNPLVGVFMSHLRTTRPIAYQSTLAWVTSSVAEDNWRTLTGPHLTFEGARKRCEESGYQLEPFWLRRPGMTSRRAARILESRGIRGLIIAGLPVSRGHVSIDFSKYAAIAVGYSMVRPRIHRVGVHVYLNVLALLRKARSLGYHRIGFVYPKDVDQRTNYCISAALNTYQAHLPAGQKVVRLEITPKMNLRSVLGRWLEKHKLDFVGGNQSIRYADIAATIQRTHKIPDDVAYAILDRLPEHKAAGIDNQNGVIGACCADQVISQLQRNEYGVPQHPLTIMVEGTWVDGVTVRQSTPS